MTIHIEFEDIEPTKLKEMAGDREALAALNSDYNDAIACRMVLVGLQEPEDAASGLSKSEAITVALAFGRDDLLPASYSDFRSAWRRINNRQRQLVDVTARAKWAAQFESPACNG